MDALDVKLQILKLDQALPHRLASLATQVVNEIAFVQVIHNGVAVRACVCVEHHSCERGGGAVLFFAVALDMDVPLCGCLQSCK